MRASEKPPVVMLTSVAWDFLWQRHQILATAFAEAGHPVVFVEGLSGSYDYGSPAYYGRILKKLARVARGRLGGETGGSKAAKARALPENLSKYECAVAPLHPKSFRKINEIFLSPRAARGIADLAGGRPIVWNFQPTTTAMQISAGLDPRLLIYDCVMNFEEVRGMPPDIAETEREWLEHADLVFADSSFLVEKHSRVRDAIIKLPPGVDYELFSRAIVEPSETVEKVCFFGGMGEGWFDFELAGRVADAGFETTLIGYADTEHPLFEHENVHYIPSVAQAALPAMISASDAIILPYKLNEFTKGVFPSKAFECLATGKPVVATPLPDFRHELSESIYLADDAEGFVEILNKLPDLETPGRVRRRMGVARANSWESRFDTVEGILEEGLHE